LKTSRSDAANDSVMDRAGVAAAASDAQSSDGAAPSQDGASEETAPPGPCGEVVQVSMGSRHVCALAGDGSLWCWGDNKDGQLGDGTTASKTAPVQVTALGSDVVQVSAGEAFTCAVKGDGSAWCWGSNAAGQLGNGKWADTLVPTLVSGLASMVAQMVVGTEHSCARKTDGTVWCWGYLNTGSTPRLSNTPEQVAGFAGNATSVAAGESHNCALKADGTVWCWGDNFGGQLGNGSLVGSSAPAQVTGLTQPASQVFAGPEDSCAIVKDGALWCWGAQNNSTTPLLRAGLPDTQEVAVQMDHSCARDTNGALWCWGANEHGQLGEGTIRPSDLPVLATAVTGAKQVAVGQAASCAIDAASKLRCWGSNDWGQLGIGSEPAQTVPLAVASLQTPVAQLAAAYASYCARMIDGTVFCWGNSFYVELGYGPQGVTSAPVQMTTLGSAVVQIAAGDAGTTCAVVADGGVWCWGMVSNARGVFDRQPIPFQVVGLPAVIEVAVGWGHTCARANDGSVWCWGRNDNGMIGSGTEFLYSLVPDQVATLGQVAVEIAAAGLHTCARMSDGTLWCWGANYEGQLGDGTTVDSPTPVQVTALGSSVRQVSASPRGHTCAALADGTAWCWGLNDEGQLGNGTTESSLAPVQVPGLASVVQLSAGESHTCARTSDGAIWCWGRNSFGQLGNGVRDLWTSVTRPVRAVAPGTFFVEVCAGPNSTCARSDNGTAWCWGTQNDGLMADGHMGYSPSAVRPGGCP
jgi:alpha-tubulin suppressor-like RCC1 family protein